MQVLQHKPAEKQVIFMWSKISILGQTVCPYICLLCFVYFLRYVSICLLSSANWKKKGGLVRLLSAPLNYFCIRHRVHFVSILASVLSKRKWKPQDSLWLCSGSMNHSVIFISLAFKPKTWKWHHFKPWWCYFLLRFLTVYKHRRVSPY